MTNPPDYPEDKVAVSAKTSPANLLQDGQWCGHGEPEFGIFDVQIKNESVFSLQLPDLDDEDESNELKAPLVLVHSVSGVTFPIYDSRKHPASLFYSEGDASDYKVSPLHENFQCQNCNNEKFNITVGFEIPSDSETPNDTSWFALAVKCVTCEWQEIIYDDETA